jgi:hypothetical protein
MSYFPKLLKTLTSLIAPNRKGEANMSVWREISLMKIVTYRPIARQRLGKHIPAEAYARNRTSIARQQISKQAFSTIQRLCFLLGPCRWVIKRQRRSFEFLSRIGSSSGDGSLRRLRRNGKKGIRLWKEDFMCDSKWQWDCYKIRCHDMTTEDWEP